MTAPFPQTEAQAEMLRAILGVSNGTLASLTAETNCTALDAIRLAWLTWVNASGATFPSWQAAWHAYQAERAEDDFARRLAAIEAELNRLEGERVAATSAAYAALAKGQTAQADEFSARAAALHEAQRRAMTRRSHLMRLGFAAARAVRVAA